MGGLRRGDVEREGDGSAREGLLSGDDEREDLGGYTWAAVALPFLFPAMAGSLFGYDIGATSGAAVSITSREMSGVEWYKLTALETGMVVSGSLYGALLGSVVVFTTADALGRRRELMLAGTMYIVGAITTSLAPSLAVLVTGRAIFGVGIGLAMHAAPMYIAETAPSQIRGTLVALKEALIVAGMLLGYLIGWWKIDTVGGWRYMFGFAAPIAFIMVAGMWYLPPSPRWLLLRATQNMKSHPETAEELKKQASLAQNRLTGTTTTSPGSDQTETEQTGLILQTAEHDGSSFVELFQGVNLKALMVGGGLVFFQQFTGQPSVLYYAAPILQRAGFSVAADATQLSVLLGFFKLAMTTVAVVNVDKVGRRPLLIAGAGGLTASLVILSCYFSFLHGFPYLAVGALLLYVGCYQVSFGPISWLMVSEIFPLRTRARAISVTTLLNFGSNAVVALAFAPLQDLVGETLTFLIFAVIGVVALVFVVTTVPETKGLSLEQIEAKLLAK